MDTSKSGSDLKQQFQDAWIRQSGSLNGEKDSLYFAKREQAYAHLLEADLPTKKQEDWKYTTFRSVLEQRPSLATASALLAEKPSFRLPFEGFTIVTLNGDFVEEWSDLPEGISVMPFSKASAESKFCEVYGSLVSDEVSFFTAANAALPGSGVYIHIPEGLVLDTPVFIISLVGENDSFTLIQERHLWVAEAGSSAQFIEWAPISQVNRFSNKVVELDIAPEASIQHYVIQDEGISYGAVRTTAVGQDRDSKYENFTLTVSGDLVRNDLNVVLRGSNADCVINGLYVLSESQHADNHSVVDHQVPDCESSEYYKGVLDNKSTGVFNGKVFVRQDAQRTNAYQQNRNLLLSDDATINTKPQLEIWADDVKCSHGATVGQLDMEQLFYLQARGIPREQAKSLLVYAFAAEVIEQISLDPIKELCLQLIDTKLGVDV